MTGRNCIVTALLFALVMVLPLSAQITFVQQNAKTSRSGSSLGVAFPATQTAGNLNVVAVMWGDTTAAVSSVTDSTGNTYVQATGPTKASGLTSAIYYAKNIAAGGNTVTVTFNQTAGWPNVNVLEYSGLDKANPLDVSSAAIGQGTTANSPLANTTFPNELIVGAGNPSSVFTAAGNGYSNRIINSFGGISEDKIVTSAGSYNATATMTSGTWVMQMAAFRASAQGSPPLLAPTMSSIGPSSGPASGGTAVTINGAGFQSGATVSLGGTAATNVVVANSTSITATTAAHPAGTVSVVVTNPDSQSASLVNGYSYGNPAPTVSSIGPSSGPANGGTAVTINGTGFQSGATVSLGGAAATNVVVANNTSITATTTAHSAGVVSAVVSNPDSQSGSMANAYSYGNPAPTVSSIGPGSGSTNGGTVVTINGTGFQSGATVSLGGSAATNVVVANSTSIMATTAAHPAGAVNVVVTNPDSQSGSSISGYTYVAPGNGVINFVQQNYKTSRPSGSSLVVPYPAAQTAGNLNIVVVGWNDTKAAVSSLSDSRGNSYSLAVGPTAGQALTQSIYYARNIAGGSNTVTVTFNQTAAYPDVRVLEYRGADPAAPLDVTAAGAGNSSSGNSGPAVTTAFNELIFGAGMTFDVYSSAGAGFTKRVITNFGDISEDATVFSTGSYSALAPLRSSAPWVMQMATFRAGSAPATGRTYTTNFPLTENPISEGGNWIGGATLGLDWTNIRTTPGYAFGTQSGTNPALFDDSIAMLSGSWAPNQDLRGTVKIVAPYTAGDPCYQESELLLRWNISAHSMTGYEVNVGQRFDSNSYIHVVRWNGPFGNFTTLLGRTGIAYGVHTGDILRATIVGNVITVYINGVQKGQVTDSTYASGNPGIGMYVQSPSSCGSGISNFGFSNYTATDGVLP